MKLPLGRIAEFIGAVGEFDGAAVAGGYSIDSRTIAPGELFFAVKGERVAINSGKSRQLRTHRE